MKKINLFDGNDRKVQVSLVRFFKFNNDMYFIYTLNEKDENSIRTFVVVISLIAQASAIKKLVQKIVNEYHS